ncbi:DUF3783 domain-containing protein [Clostridium niameyense]|uniref:DUF3783 domain-containing protein n=1 Tax=Clostridium niameyense TaxID=1622073 RepID=A0A6M0RE43_9CLOT|nr:DUF3783 domain-containing protein [Clostridium niameyense]NEZ47658.1 DUF3783 domain-containing protein [Clostridium niameyense]
MNNEKIMLIYGFIEDELNIFDYLCNEFKLPKYKIIKKDMAKMKVRDLLEGINLPVVNSKIPEEKVVLFNNFSDKELQKCIRSIKNNLESMPIMAIITDTSINWTFEYLIEHLVEEREWFKEHRNGV